MSPSILRRLDQLAVLLLLLWAGAALGFGIFSAPILFRELPSRDVAGRIAGLIIGRLVDCHAMEYGIYTGARVKLAVNLNQLEEVWVLWR